MTSLLKAGVDYPFPIVSAIIERERNGQVEILVQTRWKPGEDSKYSGAMEIPAGGIGPTENVYDALRREVYEETGLRVIGFRPDVQTRLHSQRGDAAFAFSPFCCQQETKGKPRIGFVFVCRVEEGEPRPAPGEVREIRWMNKDELREILTERAEEVFTFQLGALDFYLNYDEEEV
jgi:8-oxo-dGTP pyrophosphatase MutT (NUDIX family)